MSEENKIKVIFRRIFILQKFLFSGVKLLFSKPYWKNKLIVNLTISSLFVNLSLLVFLLYNKKEGSYPVILHYNFIFGDDYRGDYEKIYLIVSIGLIVIIINSILGYFLYLREKLASYLLIITAILVQVFLFVAGYFIVAINS
ncbi:MAG: hypothetical protein KAI67_00880 [Candidatus Pacebacteria bacterium]|nr:hypothetical protein [Candidatus Paceibacterota bacterium]